jgi:hypothetical protein
MKHPASNFLLLTCLLAIGCDADPQIRVYEVEARKPIPVTSTASNDQAEVPTCILGAIVPAGADSIYLKLRGEPEKLQSLIGDLRLIAHTTKMDQAGLVQVELPAGWSKGPAEAMAQFTLIPPSTSQVDTKMTVTLLPGATSAAEWQDKVQSNLDRWRGQVGLPPMPLAQDLQDSVEQISIDGTDLPAYLVNYVGTSNGQSSMAPFASGSNFGAASGSASPAPQKSPPTEAAAKPISYNVPEGWIEEPQTGTSMRLATLSTGNDEATSADVSLTFAGGEEKQIVQLWSEALVGDKATSDFVDGVVNSATELKAASGESAKVYKVIPQEADVANAIVAAVFKLDDQRSLFVKMSGPKQAVQDNAAKFDGFVQSIKWK